MIDDSGAPVPDARIEIFARSGGVFAADGTTDATGEYRIAGVPPGEYRLVAVADGLLSVGFRGPEIRLALALGPPARYDVELSRGATYCAQVVSGGMPLPTASVTLLIGGSQEAWDEAAFEEQVRCDEEGWVEFERLPSGEAEILVECEWLEPIHLRVSDLTHLPRALVFPPLTLLEADFVTSDGSDLPSKIQCEIRFAPDRPRTRPPDLNWGIPHPDEKHWQPPRVLALDGGRVELGRFPAGTVTVSITAQDFDAVPPLALSFGRWATERTSVERVEVELVPSPSFRWEFTVVDRDGSGVAGALVRLHGNWKWKGITDEQGVVRISGKGLPTEFEIQAVGFVPCQQSVAGGRLENRLTVELRDEATIRVHARHRDGTPGSTSIELTPLGFDAPDPIMAGDYTSLFTGLAAGRYEVRLWDDDAVGGRALVPITRIITAIEGEETVVEITLP